MVTLGYLCVAARLLKVLVIESIVPVADTELGHIFGAVWPALNLDPCDIFHISQVDDEILVKIGSLGRPRGAG